MAPYWRANVMKDTFSKLSYYSNFKSQTHPLGSREKTEILVDEGLSLLEVEHLDWNGKDESKENCEANDSNGDITQEVMSDTKVFPYKVPHCSVASFHWSVKICKLGSNQSIQCPSNRASPVIPSPPYRDSLQGIKTSVNVCLWETKCSRRMLHMKVKPKRYNLQVWEWGSRQRGSKLHRRQQKQWQQHLGLVSNRQPSYRSTWSRAVWRTWRTHTRRI